MRYTSIVGVICLFFLLNSPGILSASDRRDGNSYRRLGDMENLHYITGFFDGMILGRNFSYWGFILDKDSASCLSKVSNSYADLENKYLLNVTAGQVRDGLNNFYEDYRNRKIMVSDAIWLVLQSIGGIPKEEMEKMIEEWRRNTRN